MRQPQEVLVGFEFWQPLLGWLTVFSLFTFILSLVLIPWIVGKLPQDCFLKLDRNDRTNSPLTIGSTIMVIFRNVLGLILLLAGIAMLFLPGQGLLTILIALLLISFPGKHKLVHFLVNRQKIQRSLDWLRKKRNKPSFLWPKSQYTHNDN